VCASIRQPSTRKPDTSPQATHHFIGTFGRPESRVLNLASLVGTSLAKPVWGQYALDLILEESGVGGLKSLAK
jgi:hypothetical protein